MAKIVFSPDFLKQLIWEMPDRSGKTIKELARLVGKHSTTLDAELNPDLTHGKLGVDTWVMLLGVTGQMDSLEYVLSVLGRASCEMPEQAGDIKRILEDIGLSMEQFGDCLAGFAKCTAPESEGGINITPVEARELLPRLIRLLSLLIGLRVHLVALCIEEPK